MVKDMDDSYFNENINKCFDSWNRKYGNNIRIDEDDTDKNNISVIAKEVKKDLNAIEQDDDKVINSLVSFLYKNNSSRKKKLLWYIYGKELYENIKHNLDDSCVCWNCGKRTFEKLNSNHFCSECSSKLKYKTIKCIDCGKKFKVSKFSTKTCRCEECQKLETKKQVRENVRIYRKNMRNNSLFANDIQKIQ